MNTVERLLKIDKGEVKSPEKTIVMKLGKLGGQEFEFKLVTVDPEFVSELQENLITVDRKNKPKIGNTFELKVLVIVEGCPDVFKNSQLLKHFEVPNGKELVKKLLLPGEIDELKAQIDELSGYDAESIEKEKEDIKN